MPPATLFSPLQPYNILEKLGLSKTQALRINSLLFYCSESDGKDSLRTSLMTQISFDLQDASHSLAAVINPEAKLMLDPNDL